MGKRTKSNEGSTIPDGVAAAAAGERTPSWLRPDPLAERLRDLIRGTIEQLVEAELDDVLGAKRYERRGDADVGWRRGYRHGERDRDFTTSFGSSPITVPRARLFDEPNGATREWHSALLPRYARRSREVDESILGTYLAGANTRRVKGALKPLLKGAPMSRSAVSRVVVQIRAAYQEWARRSLADYRLAYLLLDGIHVRVRIDDQVQSVPVLVALGVDEGGEKELLGLMLMGAESTAGWATFLEDLVARDLPEPVLCVIDGNPGLHRSIEQHWPRAAIQRCVVHKLRNLEARCPTSALADLRRSFHAITEAKSERSARAAYELFLRTWTRRCEGVAKSLAEAGDELLSFYRFPKSQWKCLRTTNVIERLQEEFRRRIKTQGSLPAETSVLALFYALWESGQIRMRRLDGWSEIPAVVARHRPSPELKRA